MINLDEMKEKMKRVQLNEDMLDLVSGGISQKTADFLSVAMNDHVTHDDMVQCVTDIKNLYGDSAFEYWFGGDSLADIIDVIDQHFADRQV